MGVIGDYVEISGFIRKGSTVSGTQMDTFESPSAKEFIE